MEELDQVTTVAELRTAVQEFVDARDWGPYHQPKNLAMSIAIEAAELMEHFQWLTSAEGSTLVTDAGVHAEVADELADVLIYSLSFANAAQIDVAGAIRRKLARNEHRFPVSRVRGRRSWSADGQDG